MQSNQQSNQNALELLAQKGFEIVSTLEKKRYFYAFLKKESINYFFKIASENNSNEFLLNEIQWNNQINEALISTEDNKKPKIKIPIVTDSGIFNKKQYAIFEGLSVEKNIGNNTKVNPEFINYIPNIIDFIFWLKTLKIELPLDKSKMFNHKTETLKERILKFANFYAQAVDKKPHHLIDVIKTTPFEGMSLSHCDIRPAHLFGLDGILGIIDGEWASNKIPEHYDIALCYLRIFVSTQNPEHANSLLKSYYSRCLQEHINIEQFKNHFRGLLALRAIGGYCHAYLGKQISKEHFELERKIVENDFKELN